MSFNLASLISGSNKTNQQKTEQKTKKNEQKKSYSHGINVIFIKGIYKGYHGIVSDFYPASYELTTDGQIFVDADKFGSIKPTGSVIYTEYGKSTIQDIIPPNKDKSVELVVYKENDVLKVGSVFNLKKHYEKNKLEQYFNISEIEDPNNTFIIELTTFDDSLILNINQNLTEQMNQLHIDDNPINRLSEQIKKNDSLRYILTYPELSDINPIIVYKKDIVSTYYMNIDDESLGKFTSYNFTKTQYYISYTNNLYFKPSMIEIQKDKNFAKVKKGALSKQIYKIKAYNQARLSITLATDGKTIQSHVVGEEEDDNNQLIFKTRPIYQSDLFYMDVVLNNNNKAQIVKVIDDDNINIIEKTNNHFQTKVISKMDITRYEPGFSFDSSIKSYEIEIDDEIKINDEINDDEREHDYEENNDEKEHDYEENNEENNENYYINQEQEQQVSFKDTQRTSYEQKQLTSKQLNYKNTIERIIKLLNINENNLDIYVTINTVEQIISTIIKQLKSIDYNIDLTVTNNIKFIIVCIVLYDLVKYRKYDQDIDITISKLFPGYFTVKDLSLSHIKDNIFLKEWNKLDSNIIFESITKIKQYRKSDKDFPEIFKVLLLNCDKVIQNIMKININIINPNKIKNDDLIPVGINMITGRRIKDEQQEINLLKTQNSRKHAVLLKYLLENKSIPEKELPIIWGDSVNVLDKYRKALKEKYNNQNNNGYLYIMNNLHRGPYALKEEMPDNIRKMFDNTYRQLLGDIVSQKAKLEILKNNKRKRDEEIKEYRSTINTNDLFGEDSEDDMPIKNTRKYEREKKIREIQKSIERSTMSANRNAQQEKTNKTK